MTRSEADAEISLIRAAAATRYAADKQSDLNRRGGQPRSLSELVQSAMPAVVASAEQIEKWEKQQQDRNFRARAYECWLTSKVPPIFRGIPLEPQWDVLPETISGTPVRAPYKAAFDRLAKLETAKGGSIVALLGDRGPGKSWMGCCVIKRFCADAKRAMYCEALDYFVALRGTYGGNGSGSELAVEAIYRHPYFLVVDAIEERSETASQRQMLTRLLNKRLMDEKITLLISNDNGETLNDRVGRSLADRLNGVGGGKITCEWPSLRGYF